jgi:hypothetical protein
VTDLLSPRPAYWRRFGPPVAAPPERRARMDQGRAWHRVLESVLSDEGPTEVRVRRNGVSARIDQLADDPVEIKSGASELGGELREERPEWIEQLAMYCALVGRAGGRCAYLRASAEAGPTVRVFRIEYRSTARLAELLASGESELRAALEARDPARLPRCAWFGRGCEFQAAGVCDCRGTEPSASRAFVGEVSEIQERSEVGDRWTRALREDTGLPVPERWARFRDLLYPRRTYFEERDRAPAPPREPPGFGPPDLYERIAEAIEGGPAGDVAGLPPRGPGPEEEVVGWRGRPFLLKVSRAWNRIRPEELEERYPQYGVELGFRCARSGRREGLVVVGYERSPSDDDRLQVLSLSFAEGERGSASWEERSEALDRALHEESPLALPPCPRWMFESCPYAAVCGCGDVGARSQR